MMAVDPIALMMGNHYDPVQYQFLSHKYGFDQPVVVRYFVFLGNLFAGDWGQSIVISRGQSVWNFITPIFPRTLELAIFAIVFAAFIGILSGVVSATNRNKAKDTIIRGFSLVGVAMPVFWLGLMLQLLFAYVLNWLPSQGYNTVWFPEPKYVTGLPILDSLLTGELDIFWDRVQHIILPGITLGLVYIASFARQTRSSMLEVMEQDYIRTARAKGCAEHTVVYKHALRNSLIPTTTLIGMDFAGLLGGAVLTEYVYNYKGMGYFLIMAISRGEYFLIIAMVFLLTLIFVLASIITDVIYAYLDPRIRLK
ncbi:MAG: ABC transporter permease [Candidatus Lokiarchaeota archaeon]|nr:ABC transporter permease [Candidatus Lokiarchaeota archaeon]